MKNYLKSTFVLALLATLSMGCKKDAVQNAKSVAEVMRSSRGPFTVSSNNFKDGIVDYAFLKNDVTPHIAWENAPRGAKAFYVIMVSDLGHIYFTNTLSAEGKPIGGTQREFKLPYPIATEENAKIEIFALSDTPDEIVKGFKKQPEPSQKDNTNKSFISMMTENGMAHKIIGNTVTRYSVKQKVDTTN